MKASIGGYIFSINPSSMSWSYKMNTKSTDTYGGRVVQLLSCSLGEIVLQGYLRASRDSGNIYAEMEKFEKQMVALMDWQAANKKPLAFKFPVLDFYGDVYIIKYGNVKYSSKTSGISYSLTLKVDSGFDTVINEIRSDMAKRSLNNIPDGIGWVRSIYNTPSETGWDDALEALQTVLENAGNLTSLRLSDYYEARMKMLEAKNANNAGVVADVDDGDFGDDGGAVTSWVAGGVVGALATVHGILDMAYAVGGIEGLEDVTSNKVRDVYLENRIEGWAGGA